MYFWDHINFLTRTYIHAYIYRDCSMYIQMFTLPPNHLSVFHTNNSNNSSCRLKKRGSQSYLWNLFSGKITRAAHSLRFERVPHCLYTHSQI